MKKPLLLLFFLLAVIKIEAQQNRGIEKTDIRKVNLQQVIQNDTLKNENPKKSAKLIVPIAINKGLKQGMDNGAVTDTLKRANLKKLAAAVDIENDSLKPSAKVEVRGWDPKDKSTISKTKKPRVRGSLDSKENMRIETGVINSGEDVDIKKNVDGLESETETVDIKKNKIDVIKGTANPSNERRNGVIKNIFPPGSDHFTSITEINNFTWQLIDADIPNAVYVITITKIGNNWQPSQIFTATTPNSEISALKAKGKAGKALADVVKRTGNPNQEGENAQTDNGKYKWTVTETTTGISSNPTFFTISEK